MIQYLPFLGKVLDKVFPDPEQKAKAQLELMKLEQQGEFKELEAALERDVQQIAVNKIEAQSPDKFKSWWRPAMGWVCVLGFTYKVVGFPLLSWAAVVFDIPPPPDLDTSALFPVLLGMLGLGGMRSFERYKGVIPNGR